MSKWDSLTSHANDRVRTVQTPPNLYSKAAKRRNAIDSVITVALATLIISLSTTQLSSKVSIQSPVVREYLKQDLVASGGQR